MGFSPSDAGESGGELLPQNVVDSFGMMWLNCVVMLTEQDVDQIEQVVDRRLEEKFQMYSSRIMNAISDVMGQLKAIRESLDIFAPKVYDHEERLEKLESIHPGGQHSS